MSELDGRVIAIAGVGGGLGPLVASAAGRGRGDGRRDRPRPGAARRARPRSSASRPSAGTAAPSTCSTRTRSAAGARRWSSASAGSTGSSTWSAAGAAGSRCTRRRSPTGTAPRPADPHRPAHHPRLPRPARGQRARPLRPRLRQAGAGADSNTNAAYAAAKAAAEAWTLAFADGFEPGGATANIVVVDAILTPRMREESPARSSRPSPPPSTIAEAIAFLCSDAAEKMNGQRLPLTMRG